MRLRLTRRESWARPRRADFETFAKASASIRRHTGIDRLSARQAAEVHAAVDKHAARRLTAALIDPLAIKRPGRVADMQLAKRLAFARQLGEAYHRRVRSLYTSSRAYVAYGRGGQPETDWNAYSKSYGRPADYKLAGARIEGEAGAWVVVLETARGTEAARIPVDFAQRVTLDHPALLPGDLWGIERHGVLERYALHRGHMVRLGYAVQLPTAPFGGNLQGGYVDGQPTWVPGGPETYWEHGATLADCRREHEHKAEVYRFRQQAKALAPRIQRAARLILRLCPNLPVRYQDARAVGYCNPGIRGWCARHGIDPDGQTTVGRLVNDPQARRVAEHVALAAAERLVLKGA